MTINQKVEQIIASIDGWKAVQVDVRKGESYPVAVRQVVIEIEDEAFNGISSVQINHILQTGYAYKMYPPHVELKWKKIVSELPATAFLFKKHTPVNAFEPYISKERKLKILQKRNKEEDDIDIEIDKKIRNNSFPHNKKYPKPVKSNGIRLINLNENEEDERGFDEEEP